MRIWKWSIYDQHTGRHLGYATSKRKAKKEMHECLRNAGDDALGDELESLELTPTRDGIVRFLNLYTPGSDNG